ncbi:putative methyl-CpG DNA binding, DNA-binding domain superfamily [Helianthus anomalus]
MEEPITEGDDYASHRQLVVVEDVTPISHSFSSSSSITPLAANDSSPLQKVSPKSMSKFTLPKGWSVKKVIRKFGGSVDKYYRDPETGQMFRSLKEVERYVTEGVIPSNTRVKKLTYLPDAKVENQTTEEVTPTRTRGKRVKYHRDGTILALEDNKDNQYELAIVSSPPSPSPSSRFKLPDGWIVEEVPRRSGGSPDKYYYEQGTGQRFRSLLAVERHVTQMEENLPLSVVLEEIREKNLPLSKAFKLSSPIKNCGSYNSWKKNMSRKEKISLPSKVNWVIAGTGGDNAWNAYVDETLVPDSVKQQWGNTFMISISNTTPNAPSSA